MSYRDAFRPRSRVSSGEKNNIYLNMQWYKTAIKIWKQIISSNFKLIEFLNMQSYKSAIIKFGNKNCIDNTSALSMQIL